MAFALDELTTDELEALIIEAKAWIAKKQEEEVKSVYLQMVQLASGLGLSIDDVILRARRAGASVQAKKPKKAVAPRYRNPNNPEETWTGRGISPRWVSALQAQGISLEKLLIQH
jgi:DNA-binding protein H-NS